MYDCNVTFDPNLLLPRSKMAIPGGTGSTRVADGEIQVIADQVHPTVEAQAQRQFKEFIAETYRSQVVAGVNYFIKVHVGDNDYVHLRVYKNLQQDVQLTSFQLDKTKDDPLLYF